MARKEMYRWGGRVKCFRWWWKKLIDFPFITPDNSGELREVNNDHFQHTRLNSNYIFYAFPSSKVVFYVLSLFTSSRWIFLFFSRNETTLFTPSVTHNKVQSVFRSHSAAAAVRFFCSRVLIERTANSMLNGEERHENLQQKQQNHSDKHARKYNLIRE